MEEMDISANPVLDTGLKTRSKWTETSTIVKLQGRIHSDLFNQEKLILNVDLMMKLHCHKPEFCLLSADTTLPYQITIVNTVVYVKKIELTPSVFNAINTVLNDKNAQYAITRTTPKVFTVPRGQQSQHIDNAFLGETLKHIFKKLNLWDKPNFGPLHIMIQQSPFTLDAHNHTAMLFLNDREYLPCFSYENKHALFISPLKIPSNHT